MKIKNSTDWPVHFLRRMAGWCCRQVGLPASKLRQAEFRNRTTRSYSGHAYYGGRVVCSIGPAHRFPLAPDTRDGMAGEIIADRVEALVAITAHEVEHIHQFRTGKMNKIAGRVEAHTRAVEVRVLRAFRAARETLLAEWSVEPVRIEKPKASIKERRASKAADDLARWQRKLKLAQTKVRKLKVRVRYYDLQQAASRPQ
jgi:alkyl hydroperoxide reductase subunit AhpF